MEEIVTILTDAATVGIFDPKQLIPHFNDEAGWWAAPTPELQELNKGTLMVVYLGADGYYDLHIHDGILRSNGLAVTAKVRCSSGQLFIGPGEDIPAEELMPKDGAFLVLQPGVYKITVAAYGEFRVEILIEATDESAQNFFEDSLRIHR